jgi:hypothetical protein
VPVSVGLMDETRAIEHTQRTRSFLLAAMALVAAEIERADRIRFYENGIMSVNLPIATQAVGARCSRSTHPRSLVLLQELGRLIRQDSISIENPFIWKTKVEVVKDLWGKPEGKAIKYTLSCSRTRQTKLPPSLRHMCSVPTTPYRNARRWSCRGRSERVVCNRPSARAAPTRRGSRDGRRHSAQRARISKLPQLPGSH